MEFLRMSELDYIDKIAYIESVRCFLEDLIIEYPLHNIWFEKMINSMEKNYDREILLSINNNILMGIAILKNTKSEKKICTLRVGENFQKRGIGKKLITESMEILETNKPIITISQKKYDEFKKLFYYCGFDLEEIHYGKYKKGLCEFVYNGRLMPETLIGEEQKTINTWSIYENSYINNKKIAMA